MAATLEPVRELISFCEGCRAVSALAISATAVLYFEMVAAILLLIVRVLCRSVERIAASAQNNACVVLAVSFSQCH